MSEIRVRKRNYSVPEHLGLFLTNFGRGEKNMQQEANAGLEILFRCMYVCKYALSMLIYLELHSVHLGVPVFYFFVGFLL